jgi:hypothetical protein
MLTDRNEENVCVSVSVCARVCERERVSEKKMN